MRESARWTRFRIGDHQLRYSVMGQGPALVLPKKDRGVYEPAAVFAERYRVVQVEPIGFGGSDRPQTYPPISVPEQILAVCDAESIEEFAVWGFSQGGAMACAVAQATRRARALVWGGFNALRPPSPAWVARMNQEQRVAVGSRAFWNYFTQFDWHGELGRLRVPALTYAGTRDRQFPRCQDQQILEALRIEVHAFEGLDHSQCGFGAVSSPATTLVVDWLSRHWRC